MSSTLTFKEALAVLNVSDSTLRRLVREKRISCYRVGFGRGAIRFDRGHLEDFLATSEQKVDQR
jgi:excisionase family DNA binding protein